MKRIFSFILISTTSIFPAAAQYAQPDLEEVSQPPATFHLQKVNSHALFPGTRTFEIHSDERITRLELNPDSTFYFIQEFYYGYLCRVSVGNWSIFNDTVIIFNTNNTLSAAAAPAAKPIGTRLVHLPAKAVELDHWAFVEKNGSLYFADGPESERGKIFKNYKSRMRYPIKSTAAQKEEDLKNNIHNGEGDMGSTVVRFTRPIPEDVYAIFDGEVIMVTDIDSSLYLVMAKYDDYYVTYVGIEKPGLYKGQHIRMGEKIARTTKDIDGKFTLELYMAKRMKQLQPFEWLEE